MLETIFDGEIPLPPEPVEWPPLGRNGSHVGDDTADDEGPTTWGPVDLGPFLRGEAPQPRPTVGIRRSDGQQLLYPGREHAVLGETESGKTWLALACVAAEIVAGHRVLYIHYEESDPASTVERLRLLGVSPERMVGQLCFVAPQRPVHTEWLTALLVPAPTLVVHDGLNEGMSLHGNDIMGAEGWSAFRRRLVTPCLRAGAAVLACDHLPKNVEGRGRDAYGSVHKGNAIDGARIVLENTKPFGRGLRGVSYVFVTKDRPGQLRAHGRPSSTPGKTFVGTLTVDDGPTQGEDFLGFYPPKDDDAPPAAGTDHPALVHAAIEALPGQSVGSMRLLYAEMRKAGHALRDSAVRAAVDDLIVEGRLAEVPGSRGARGYKIIPAPTATDGAPT